jgi:hypothetical protein
MSRGEHNPYQRDLEHVDLLLTFKYRSRFDSPNPCLLLNVSMSHQGTEHRPPPITFTELLLKTAILAVLTPLLWLLSKLSPVQFLIGGTALVFAAYLLSLISRLPCQCPPAISATRGMWSGRVPGQPD